MPQYFSSTWRTLTHPSKPIMPLIHSPQDSNMGLWVLGPNDRYQAVLILMLSDFSHWSQTSPAFLLLRECGSFPLNLCHFIRHSSPTWPVHVLAGPQSLSLLRQVSEFNSGLGISSQLANTPLLHSPTSAPAEIKKILYSPSP